MLVSQIISIGWLYYLSTSQVLAYGNLISEKPRDYAQSFTNSRVSGLVHFFELLQKSSESAEVSSRTDVILSLSESASKLYTLAHGQPLELKCDKYIKLLSRPNIRTVATISVLMKESQAFSEINQRDSNLMAKLVSERQFDALARIQTILQSLEMERVMGKSSLQPNVEMALLDCVNYYIYRHQRATIDVVRHVRESLEKLPQSLVVSGRQEVTLRKLAQAIDNVRVLEEDQDQNNFQLERWLAELKAIHQLTLETNFELPEKVREFLTNPKRKQRLHLIDRGEELKTRLLEFESLAHLTDTDHDKYLVVLKNLQDICHEFIQIMPQATCALLQHPRRQKLVSSNQDKYGSQLVSSAPKSGKDTNSLEYPRHVSPVIKPLSTSKVFAEDNSFDSGTQKIDKIEHSNLANSTPLEASQKLAEASLPASKSRGRPNFEHAPLVSREKAPKIWKNKGTRRTGNSSYKKAARQIFLPKICVDLLRQVELFLVNYDGVNISPELIKGAAKLRQFKFECLSDKGEERKLLEARLKSGCKSNPFLISKKECQSMVARLERLGEEEEEHIHS